MRQIFTLFIWLWAGCISAQDYRAVACQLYESYYDFRESAIPNRRFKHSDVVPLIQRLQGKPGIESVRVAGRSIEGRDLYLVRIGNGPVPVLLWSQMHGDEPTATMALLDIFRFFTRSGDGFDALRSQLRSRLSLYFLPLLNPDGAERYQRRNAIDIDLNRDALRLQSPEARLLKDVRDELNAEWGFNLHDQSAYYAAGRSEQSASFSFLAPAYDYEKSVKFCRAWVLGPG
jgi:murein tripeptide amidase MpaA